MKVYFRANLWSSSYIFLQFILAFKFTTKIIYNLPYYTQRDSYLKISQMFKIYAISEEINYYSMFFSGSIKIKHKQQYNILKRNLIYDNSFNFGWNGWSILRKNVYPCVSIKISQKAIKYISFLISNVSQMLQMLPMASNVDLKKKNCVQPYLYLP